MSQQITSSKLRKGFLVIGIVLLILGFFFFYWASRIDWDYRSIKNYSVIAQDFLNNGDTTYYNFSTPSWVEEGVVREYSLFLGNPAYMEMQKGDDLLVEWDYGTSLGHSHIVLYGGGLYSSIVAKSSADSPNLVSFTSESNYNLISIYITVPFDGNFTNLSASLSTPLTRNIPSVTVTLDHYETPQWVIFGIGVVLSSLAIIPIFKSKK